MPIPATPITMCADRGGLGSLRGLGDVRGVAARSVPPIGGHAFHPVRWPIARHTTWAGRRILKSSPEDIGAGHEKPTHTGELRNDYHHPHLRPLLRSADRLGRNHRRRGPWYGRHG